MFNSKSYKTTPAYACLLLAVIALSSAQVKADELASPKEIVAMLKQGGYVIYLRHGATNHKQNDGDLSDLRECSNQRNLSSQGKKESRILGETFKKLGIKKLSIETGSGKFFEPARKLFAKLGFQPCSPFAHYKDDPNSCFFTKNLS